jgi:CheY-like chemotaxis protein
VNLLIKKTEEMESYEHETGKQALWQGRITKGFEKWKEGEKNYYEDKKRISVYISRETEKKWQDYVEKSEFSTLSKLIRESVNNFIHQNSEQMSRFGSTFEKELSSAASYELKQKLTTIKGFLQLILESYNGEINEQIKGIINNVFEQAKQLESKFITKNEEKMYLEPEYDVLLIEDDIATVELITNYFESKGYSCKGEFTGSAGLEKLKTYKPKLILLDVILPDISGFEVCKKIKFSDNLKDLPVYFITAIPRFKVQEKMEETRANGYIMKPFDLADFDFLFEQL